GSGQHENLRTQIHDKAETITNPEEKKRFLENWDATLKLGKTPAMSPGVRVMETEKAYKDMGYLTPSMERTIARHEKLYGGDVAKAKADLDKFSKQRDAIQRTEIMQAKA